jgi:hypothetical protein
MPLNSLARGIEPRAKATNLDAAAVLDHGQLGMDVRRSIPRCFHPARVINGCVAQDGQHVF